MSPQLVAGGPRVLLRRLREIMAERQSAQARLDKLVSVIASNMVAEVCSIYLRRAGAVLELFATQGLNPDAVHRTRLKPGEGLVGLVAQTAAPLNLSNAPEHPSFSYRPETGEDPYRSFLAVPIVRGESVFGVLTVQNRTARHYDEEEEEALATIAMVLAEVVGQGTLVDLAEIDEAELSPTRPAVFHGDCLTEGLAIGTVFLHQPRVQDETRARINRTNDPYLRERLHDFDDLARRLMRHLAKSDGAESQVLPDRAVVVARTMGPAELLDYGRNRITALVVEEASQTSHIAIVARSLSIPLVGGAEGASDAART